MKKNAPIILAGSPYPISLIARGVNTNECSGQLSGVHLNVCKLNPSCCISCTADGRYTISVTCGPVLIYRSVNAKKDVFNLFSCYDTGRDDVRPSTQCPDPHPWAENHSFSGVLIQEHSLPEERGPLGEYWHNMACIPLVRH